MVEKKYYGVFLMLVILSTSLYFVFDDKAKILIENTRTQYFVDNRGSWDLAATEYVNLYDGTKKMRAKSRDVIYWNTAKYVYAQRTSTWKDNITTIQTYTFSIDSKDITQFPIDNEFNCINCEGKIVHYEIRDILYMGVTKTITSLFKFGNHMSIEWRPGYYYAKVFQQKVASDKIIIKYRPTTSNETYYVRLFDPPGEGTTNLVSYNSFETGTRDDWGSYPIDVQFGAKGANGYIGDSFYLDGNNDAFNYTTLSLANFNHFTVNAWVDPDNNNFKNIMEEASMFRMRIDSGDTFICRVYNASATAFSTSAIAISGDYEMYSCVYNVTHICAYINGTGEQCTAVSGALATPTTELTVGRQPPSSNYLEGDIDEISFWNSSAVDLAAMYTDYENTIRPQDTGNFYFSNTGSDLELCNILTKPCDTPARFDNLTTWTSGDTAYWARGSSWVMGSNQAFSLSDATAGNRKTFAAYGSGDKPLFIGGPTTNFTATSVADEYLTTVTSSLDVGHIYCTDALVIGNKESTAGAVTINGEFFYNGTGDDKTLTHSSTDLTTVYNCRIAQEDNFIEISNLNHWNFYNLSFKYGGQHGFGDSGSTDITLDGIDMAFIGGAYQATTVRYGNGVQFGLEQNDILVQNCNITQVYDAAYTSQLWNTGGQHTLRNVTYRNNIGALSAYPFEYFNSFSTSTTADLTIDHNTFVDAGLGWADTFGNDGRGIRASGTPSATTGFNMTNNIFDNTTLYLIDFSSDADWHTDEMNIDNNLYWAKATNFGRWNGSTKVAFSNYQSDSGKDGNGDYADPEFTDKAIANYQPKAGSTACLMSSTGSYVGALPCAVTPSGGAINLTVNGSLTDLDIELATPVTVNTSINGGATVCIDVNHSSYGVNYSCGTTSTSFSLEIDSFRRTTFNDSTTAKNVTYTTGALANQTVYINVHQYDEIDFLLFDITGFISGGSYTSDVKIYINDTLSNNLGDIFAASLSKFNNEDTSDNTTFTSSSTTEATNIKVLDGTTVTSALLNVSGYNYTTAKEYNLVSTSGTFDSAAINAYDGSWTTYTTTESGGTANIYFNYTKPTGYLNQSTWEVKDFDDRVNLTIPGTCLAQTDLQVKVNMESFSSEIYTDLNSAESHENNWTLRGMAYWATNQIRAENLQYVGDEYYSYITKSINLTSYDDVSVSIQMRYPPGTVKGSFMCFAWSCLSTGTGFTAPYRWATNSVTAQSRCIEYDIQERDTWYTRNQDIFDATISGESCETPPENFSIAVYGDVPFSYIIQWRNLYITGNEFTNVTWSCNNGSDWINIRENRYNGSTSSAKVYEETVNWISYPQSPWMEVGTINGTRDWNFTGEFSESDNQSNDFTGKMNNYISGCTFDDDGFCSIPITLFSDGIGILELKDLHVTYDYDVNPITIDNTVLSTYITTLNGFGTIPIKFESSSNGTIQIDDLNFEYKGGNKTYQVKAHNTAYTTNKTLNLTYYHSRWNYTLPPYIDYLEVIPDTPTTANVQPYGQNTNYPILNFTSLAYGGKTFNFTMLSNETYSCVNTSYSNTTTNPSNLLGSSTWQDLKLDVDYLETVGLWMWFDYGCNFTSWNLWEPDWYFRACCDGCICSESTS